MTTKLPLPFQLGYLASLAPATPSGAKEHALLPAAFYEVFTTNLYKMDTHGHGHEHAWPGQIGEKDVPGIDDWLMDAENSRPGCLITWYENDAINACFDEEAQHMGENGPCQPNMALPIHLNKPTKELDEEVRRVFDYAGAMLRSLASAAKIVELVRDLYDEYLREPRLEPGLPAEPGAAGVREEQL
ncbi:MAG: hypothetical protein WA172_06765 [Terriglobales bacterium]